MIKLTKRLQAVADLVKQNSVIVDVGCDHGYIPVYLVKQGICPRAIASDVNQGPLNSCKYLVSQEGLNDKISCVLSDGLDKIDDDFDTVIIAGMGGELISEILSRSSVAKNCSLVINPMTHAEVVRKWLFTNGFEIDKDIIVPDGRYHYSIMSAHYTGDISAKTDIDYFLGEIIDYSDKEYFEHLLVYLNNKQKSGLDYSTVIKTIKDRI